MKHHWKDFKTETDEWVGLAIYCEPTHSETDAPRAPPVHLQSCNNARMKLIGPNGPIFWATFANDYYGVHLLKANTDHFSPIASTAISSAEIENRKREPHENWLPSWARFFADQLAISPMSMLHPGLWMMQSVPHKYGWVFEGMHENKSHIRNWRSPIYDVKDALEKDALVYIDWEAAGSARLLNLKVPNAESGRVKWWRKKARENALPPILVWYLSNLTDYVIIDGHDRLQAAILEDMPPDFLVLQSGNEIAVEPNFENQAKVLHSLEHRAANKKFKPISTEDLNAVLIQAFDDRPEISIHTRAWATRLTQETWLAEVEARLKELKRQDEFQVFLERD